MPDRDVRSRFDPERYQRQNQGRCQITPGADQERRDLLDPDPDRQEDRAPDEVDRRKGGPGQECGTPSGSVRLAVLPHRSLHCESGAHSSGVRAAGTYQIVQPPSRTSIWPVM
jgi:hypothetical protein